MTSDRIEELMKQTAYPESASVLSAMNQVWTEMQQCFNARSCENCVHFNLEVGTQPDGLGWERSECENGIAVQCMEYDYTKMLCQDWEKQK